jgi:hypothetical protein
MFNLQVSNPSVTNPKFRNLRATVSNTIVVNRNWKEILPHHLAEKSAIRRSDFPTVGPAFPSKRNSLGKKRPFVALLCGQLSAKPKERPKTLGGLA